MNPSSSDFANTIVLVTGGARGIGRACVEQFAKAGAKVGLNYRTSEQEARETAARHPGRVFPLPGDLSTEPEVERVFAELERQAGGPPSILINNAGVVNREKFPDVSGETFTRILKVNTVGPYLCTKVFVRRNGGRAGVIVNIGSMRAFQPTTVDYSASKAALHNLTVSLAKTLAPDIRVNAVAPGFTDTPMHDGSRDRLRAEGAKSLLKRVSTPEDIADAVLFLASPAARSITGQILLVDNGRSLAG